MTKIPVTTIPVIPNTIKDAKAQLATLGITLSKNVHGEFRVRIKGSPAGEGYFTMDFTDAFVTGIQMSKRIAKAKSEQVGESQQGKVFEQVKNPTTPGGITIPHLVKNSKATDILFCLLHYQAINARRTSREAFRDWTHSLPTSVRMYRDAGLTFKTVNCGFGPLPADFEVGYRLNLHLQHYLQNTFESVAADHMSAIKNDPREIPGLKAAVTELEQLRQVRLKLHSMTFREMQHHCINLWSGTFFHDLCYRWYATYQAGVSNIELPTMQVLSEADIKEFISAIPKGW